MEVKSGFYDYLFCMMIFSLPYSIKLPNILIIALTLLFVADFRTFNSNYFKRLRQLPLIILAILIIYWFFKGLITNSISETKYALLIPIALLPVLSLKIKNVNRVLFAIALCGLLVALRAVYGLTDYYLKHDMLLLFEGDEINDILGMERPYMGFLSVLAIISAVKLAAEYDKYKFWFVAYCLLMASFIFLISARISALTIFTLGIIYLCFYLAMPFKKKIAYFLILVGISLAIIVSNKNLRQRLFISDSRQESLTALKRYEPRVIIWNCARLIAATEDFNPIIGLDSEAELNAQFAACYDNTMFNKHRSNYFITTKLNSHNQFVGTYLTSGLIGLVALVVFFISLLRLHRENFITTAFMISLILLFMVENVFRRQIGTYLFAMVISIITIWQAKRNEIGREKST